MNPKLFKTTLNTAAGEFKRYFPVNINLRFETITSHLALAEQNYIKPLLGNALFDTLVSYYESHETADTYLDRLLDLVRYAEMRLALWKGFDSIQAMISDTGIATNVEKDNRLFRYQEENLKTSLKIDGFDQLDEVLAYCETNIANLANFATSPYHTNINKYIIKNTEMFNDCYNIEGSRLVFLKMLQYVRDVELLKLQHRIGAAFYAELLTADTSEKYTRIMPAIRMFVVYSAVADGIGELHKLPTEKGLLFESNSADNVEIKPVDSEQLEDTRHQFSAKAELYLASAINTIKEHISDHGNYTSFAGESPADGVIHIDNTNHKTFLA